MYDSRSPGVLVRHQSLSSGHCPAGTISKFLRLIRQQRGMVFAQAIFDADMGQIIPVEILFVTRLCLALQKVTGDNKQSRASAGMTTGGLAPPEPESRAAKRANASERSD